MVTGTGEWYGRGTVKLAGFETGGTRNQAYLERKRGNPGNPRMCIFLEAPDRRAQMTAGGLAKRVGSPAYPQGHGSRAQEMGSAQIPCLERVIVFFPTLTNSIDPPPINKSALCRPIGSDQASAMNPGPTGVAPPRVNLLRKDGKTTGTA